MNENDLRIVGLARILVDHSLEVRQGHKVLISAPSDAKPLVLAVHKECILRGSYPWQRIQFPETDSIFFEFSEDHQIDFLSPVDMSVLEKPDRLLFIRTETNTGYLEKIDPARIARRRLAIGPAHELMNSKRWCATFFPSEALAKRAGLSLADFSEIFFTSVNHDWTELEEKGKALAERLNRSRWIRIEGSGTDLEFSIAGRTAVVGGGRFNMPDGEVYTAPVEDSTRGRVLFDLPVDFDGHPIREAVLEFEHGRVIRSEAIEGKPSLDSLLDTDEGARRLGEFAIGINYEMVRPLGHIALDEKIGGTMHLAIGFTPPDTGGTNKSAIHFDLLKDLRSKGRIVADGQTIMEKGQLLF